MSSEATLLITMFPNFKSLADKRNQRKKLLEQIEREQELERIKNEAYSVTDWASDQAKLLALQQVAIQPSTNTITTSSAVAPAVTVAPTANPTSTVAPAVVPTTDIQQQAKKQIEDIYKQNPILISKKISPIKSSGLPDNDVYIGLDGDLFNINTDRRSRKVDTNFDYVLTLNHVNEIAINALTNVEEKSEPPNTVATGDSSELFNKNML